MLRTAAACARKCTQHGKGMVFLCSLGLADMFFFSLSPVPTQFSLSLSSGLLPGTLSSEVGAEVCFRLSLLLIGAVVCLHDNAHDTAWLHHRRTPRLASTEVAAYIVVSLHNPSVRISPCTFFLPILTHGTYHPLSNLWYPSFSGTVAESHTRYVSHMSPFATAHCHVQ